MKKILLLFTLIFTITTSAQYTILSAVDIKEGMEDQYLQLEEFFGPVHDLAIKQGIQDLQAVFKVVSTNDDGDNVANYFIVTGKLCIFQPKLIPPSTLKIFFEIDFSKTKFPACIDLIPDLQIKNNFVSLFIFKLFISSRKL